MSPRRVDPADEAPPSAPLVPGSLHRVHIGGRDDHGRGLAKVHGRALRVRNALPGETVDVKLVHIGRHVAVGRIETVVEAAADRVEDACEHGRVCPGCGLRTSSPENRRAFVRNRVVAAFAAAGITDAPIEETVAAPSEDGWRHKAFLTARRTRRGIFLGLFEEQTHHLLSVEGCLAHAPAVESTLKGIRLALERVDPSIYDERSGQGWLRTVAVRASSLSGETLVTLVATARSSDAERALSEEIRLRSNRVAGVVLNVHPDKGNAPFGSRFVPLGGLTALDEQSGAWPLRVSAGSFFQVNPVVAALLHDAVRVAAATAPPGPALDLYGGVGATSIRLEADGRTVTLVEAPGSAAEDAAANVARHCPGKVEVIAGRVEETWPQLAGLRPSVVVANPPRSGLPPAVREGIAALSPAVIISVACDPAPLAKDAIAWAAKGYRLESVTPFELMPQTPHVEAVAVFRR